MHKPGLQRYYLGDTRTAPQLIKEPLYGYRYRSRSPSLVKALVQGDDPELAHRIRQNLYGAAEEMLLSNTPAAQVVGRMADFGRDVSRG